MSLEDFSLMNTKDDGYHGIWSSNGSAVSDDEYKFVHYSGGFATAFAKQIPMASYAPHVNRTFFCYGGASRDGRRILIMAAYYDHEAGTVPRPTILMDRGVDDAHENPGLMLDGEGFVWVFVNAHGAARPAFIFKSREPYSVDTFDLVLRTNFSYAQPWFIKGRGWIFLHTRYASSPERTDNRYLHWATSADGVHWSEPHALACIATGHYQVSWRQAKKVGTAFNYHPHERLPNDMRRTNLYYVETEDFGQTWRSAQGEPLETPLEAAANPALVRNYESEALRVYMKDMDFDAEGHPVILFLTSPGAASGPQNAPRIWTVAHWTGERWDIYEVTRSDNNYDTGCLHVEEDGTWRIIGPTEPGPQRYNAGGEVAIWTSNNEGRTWTKVRQGTRNSPFNHTYVRRPVDAHPDFYAFWADGHAREASPSRLYFCDQTGQKVFRLPTRMATDAEPPERIDSTRL